MTTIKQRLKTFSMGTVRQWHWISSAVCLVGMLLFAITGITLNHAADIKATPQVTSLEVELTPALLAQLNGRTEGPLPVAVREWLARNHDMRVPNIAGEWSEDEVYVGIPKPGGDAWLAIDLEQGLLQYENTDRGWVSYFNDLHKGRHTGVAWSWFIDIFSLLCIVFCLSGLWLLMRYAAQRPSTWPWVGLGVVIPLLIIVLTVH